MISRKYFDIIGNMEMRMAVEALAALAQETRLGIFRTLVEAGPRGLAAGAIAKGADIPPATLSFHLARLERARLLHSARNGRSILYAADFGTVDQLITYLLENCCRSGASACEPK